MVDSSAFSNKIRSNIEHTFARPVSCFDRFPPEIKTHRHKVVVAAAAAAVKMKMNTMETEKPELLETEKLKSSRGTKQNRISHTRQLSSIGKTKKLSKKNVVEVLASAVEHQILVFSKWILGVLGPS